MRFKDYFTGDFETCDEHFYPTLRTRYYRARTDDALNALHEVIDSEKGKIKDENKTYLEILFETAAYSCICKMTSVTPVETAIDFKVTTFGLIGFGKGKKTIERLYGELDKKLPFKGIGLFKG